MDSNPLQKQNFETSESSEKRHTAHQGTPGHTRINTWEIQPWLCINLSRFDLKIIDMPKGLKVLLTPIHKGFQNISDYHHMISLESYGFHDIHMIFIHMFTNFSFHIWFTYLLACLRKSFATSACAQLSQRAPTRPGFQSRTLCHSAIWICWELDKKHQQISTEISTDVNMIYCLERIVFFLFYLVSSCIKFRKTFAIWNGKTKTQVATSSTAKSCACFAKACTRIGAQTLKQYCRYG